MSCYEDRYGYTRSFVETEIYGWAKSTRELEEEEEEAYQRQKLAEEKRKKEEEDEKNRQISALVEKALQTQPQKEKKSKKVKKKTVETFSLDDD
jgi:hypothetical protein